MLSLLLLLFFVCRFVEKGNLEVQLFILTSKLRANHQKNYVPPEGTTMNDINRVRHVKPFIDLKARILPSIP